MPQIRFTDAAIRNLPKPDAGQVDYFDERERGFGIRVGGGTRSTAVKTFFIKYVFNGKQRRHTLRDDREESESGTPGPARYPAVSLADARKLVTAAKADIARGIDPATKHEAARKAAREAMTFREMAELYIDNHAKPKKRSWREDQRILWTYCLPWHDRRAADIEPEDVGEILREIANGGAGVMANRVLACIRKLYNFHIGNPMKGRQRIVSNPTDRMARPAIEAERDRTYSENEIRALWEAFGQCGLPGFVYKMLLATGQRLSEVAGMQRSELDGAIWTLPGTRTKNGRLHVVPLNTIALDVLADLGALDEVLVFPSPTRPGQPIANFGKAAKKVRGLPGVEDFRAHDLRRTVQTGITRLRFPRFIADRLLNHVEPGVGSRYDRHDYLREKTEAADAWGRWLANVVGAEGAVVQMTPRERGEGAV